MTRITLGLPAAEQDISVTQGDQSASATATPPGAPAIYNSQTAAPRFWGASSLVPEQGYTFGICWNSVAFGTTQPNRRRSFGLSADVSGNRFWSPDLPDGDTIMSTAPWHGGRVLIYGIDNGIFSYRGQRTIIGGATRPVGVPTGRTGYVTGTSYRYSFPGWVRPKTANGVTLENADFWFGVAGIDLTGNQVGAITWTGSSFNTGSQAAGSAGATTANDGNIPDGEVFDETGVPNSPASITATQAAANSLTFDLSWDAAAGVDGYRVYYSWQDPTTLPAAPYLECSAGSPALRNGDMLVIETPDLLTVDYRWVSGRSADASEADRYFRSPTAWTQNPQNKPNLGQTWQCIAHGTRPFSDSGAHFTRLTVNPDQMIAAGNNVNRMNLNVVNYCAGTGQSFRYIPKAGDQVSMRVRLRASQPVRLHVALCVFGSNLNGYSQNGEQAINVSTNWQTFNLTDVWTLPLGNTAGTGYSAIYFKTSDRSTPFTIDCDLLDFRFPEQDRVPFLPTAAIQAARPGMWVRDHGTVKRYPNGCNMDQLLDVPGRSGHGAQISSQLFDRKTANARNHFQFDCIVHDPDEMLDWVKYMADPNDQRRIAQGQVAPWTQELGTVLFEPMNEAWNTISEFYTFFDVTDGATGQNVSRGYVFGAYCAWLWQLIKSSPYYRDGEWDLMLGGWADNNGNWNVQAMAGYVANRDIGDTFLPILAIAGYVGGWERTNAMAQNTDGSYANTLGSAQSANLPPQQQLVSMRDTYPGIRFANYETGPGFQKAGLNGASVTNAQEIQQETANNSRAMGTSSLASFMYGISEAEMVTQNYFLFGFGDTWNFGRPTYWGGGLKGHIEPHRILHDYLGTYRAAVMRASVVRETQVFLSTAQSVNVKDCAAWLLRSSGNPARAAIVACNFRDDASLVLTVSTTLRSATSAQRIYDAGDFRRHDRYSVGYRWFRDLPQVDGAGQSGTVLDTRRWSMPPIVGKTFTIAGDATTYTISATEGYETEFGYFTLDQSLAATPADGAAITVTEGTARGELVVRGGGQSGSELYVSGGTLTNGGTFTIAGNATEYTVQSQRHFAATDGRVTITPALQATPADGALISYQDANPATNLWADATSVRFNFTPVTIAGGVPDLSSVVLDDSVGLPSSGIEPGNFAIILLDGVT